VGVAAAVVANYTRKQTPGACIHVGLHNICEDRCTSRFQADIKSPRPRQLAAAAVSLPRPGQTLSYLPTPALIKTVHSTISSLRPFHSANVRNQHDNRGRRRNRPVDLGTWEPFVVAGPTPYRPLPHSYP
jgi:hypothetical protein